MMNQESKGFSLIESHRRCDYRHYRRHRDPLIFSLPGARERRFSPAKSLRTMSSAEATYQATAPAAGSYGPVSNMVAQSLVDAVLVAARRVLQVTTGKRRPLRLPRPVFTIGATPVTTSGVTATERTIFCIDQTGVLKSNPPPAALSPRMHRGRLCRIGQLDYD